MDNLRDELKAKIIEQLNLEDFQPDEIDNSAPLFGDDGLGLDSIDALEFIVLLEQHYGIKISDPSQGKEIFYSINSLADYVEKHR